MMSYPFIVNVNKVLEIPMIKQVCHCHANRNVYFECEFVYYINFLKNTLGLGTMNQYFDRMFFVLTHHLNRACGNTIPADIIEEGGALTIQFCSDYSVRRRGFHARYTLIDCKYCIIKQQK